ncbi:Proline-rich protein 23A3 [Lemmus lemmus]
MLGVGPSSPGTDPEPHWAPQAQGPSPAKRCCLQEPQLPPDLEETARSASDASTSMVFLATGCTMQLQLDGVELLLEPDPT